MNAFLLTVDAWIIALLLGAAMLAVWAVSLWWGRAAAKAGPDAPATKFTDATLAIFGLLLAFTFSMALSKHDQRRLLAVADSNAIGNFYTCVSLLKNPLRARGRELVRHYVEHRLSLARSAPSETSLAQELEGMRERHRQMESLVKEAVDGGTPVVVPLVNALNGLTSSHASRLGAIRDRLPPSVVLVLTVAAVLVMVQVGYRQGAAAEWRPGGTIGFIVLVCLVVWVILDLNQPQRGWITVSQESLEQLLSGMSE